jgi:hypothetical protein
MIVSKNQTNTLAIKASTNSEWDSVDFAILHLTPEWIELMKNRLKLVEQCKNSVGFYNITWWDCPDGYFIHGDEGVTDTGCLDEDEHYKNVGWCYVKLTQDELDKYPAPEQKIDAEVIRINGDGDAWFAGYGKHTSEEFYTSRFPISKIIKDYNYKNSLDV